MKTIRLNISNIHTVRALHVYLAYMLDFPPYYGRNLDALHDMLCEECEDMHVELEGMPASAEMQTYMPRLVRVMEDCARENARIHLRTAL